MTLPSNSDVLTDLQLFHESVQKIDRMPMDEVLTMEKSIRKQLVDKTVDSSLYQSALGVLAACTQRKMVLTGQQIAPAKAVGLRDSSFEINKASGSATLADIQNRIEIAKNQDDENAQKYWQAFYDRQKQINELTPDATPEQVKEINEKYPLPDSPQTTRDLAFEQRQKIAKQSQETPGE